MASTPLQSGIFEFNVHRILLMHDGGNGFESNAEVDRLSV
jgi:hypothetical protein